MVYDLIIIGGGPAGTAAAVYAGRKQLKTLIITESFGGQSVVSADIQNWIGEKSIGGAELAKKFEEHIKEQKTVEVKSPFRATKVLKNQDNFLVETNKGENFEAKTIIVVSGARRRKLGIPGEDKFEGTGVAYCATCDAPLFAGKDVAVVGGGNAGFEATIDLLPYANKIYLLEYADKLKADPITQEKVKKEEKVEIILNAQAKEVEGDKFVNALTYIDTKSNEEKKLNVGGVFVQIGSVPNSDFIKDLVKINKRGEIIIDHQTAGTSVEGIYAAGDVTDEFYKQNNISAGDGVKAALSAYQYIISQK